MYIHIQSPRNTLNHKVLASTYYTDLNWNSSLQAFGSSDMNLDQEVSDELKY